MSTSTISWESRTHRLVAKIGDYIELTKPRIAVLVLVTVAVAGYVARWGQCDPLLLLHGLIGTLLVAGSASAFNQLMEIESDRQMERTSRRPLPAGRLSVWQVTAFGSITVVGGIAYLGFLTNWMAAGWAFATWFVYVVIYTPAKSRTHWNTAIGAVSGALPMLIGWTVTGAALDMRALSLFLLLFLWQFPHFMAIAWIYRRQYAGAGMKMMTVVDPSGRRAGVQAVVGALALLPVSMIPAIYAPGLGALAFVAFALSIGVWQLRCAWRFLTNLDESSSRRLLHASLIYLPLVLVLLVVLP